MTDRPRVTVWNEGRHEKKSAEIARIYPEGIHGALASHLRSQGFEVKTATLDDPEHGLSAEVLAQTDVLTWWGHMAHGEVQDEIVERVKHRVLEGMGLIVLHSGHFSKIFRSLMGTSCDLKWREMGENERLWVVAPDHPIAVGVGEYIDIDHEEMYGEFFDIPAPDQLVFISWFKGGEVFRSGCCYTRGQGRIFYFRPGHESLPTYYHPQVLRVISNAILWAASSGVQKMTFGHRPNPIEVVK
jgi:trehalose utilization protein